MPETFDSIAADPGSGGANLAGDEFTQSAATLFLPACYLVFGAAGGPYTRVDSGAGLPVSLQNASIAVTGTFWQATQPVSLASVPAHAVTDGGLSLTVDAPVGTPAFVRLSDGSAAISTLPVSLASVPSHPVTNAGTFAVQADTELPAAAALSDATANPTAPMVGAAGMLWDGSQWVRGQGKETGTLLAYAAYTATQSGSASPTVSRTASGVIVHVRVGSVGTGTLTLNLCEVDPVWSQGLVVAAAAVTASPGTYRASWCPGASGTGLGVILSASHPLPREWYVVLSKSDGSSWTFGASYTLVP